MGNDVVSIWLSSGRIIQIRRRKRRAGYANRNYATNLSNEIHAKVGSAVEWVEKYGLDVSLSLEGGKSVYERKNVPTGSFTVTVNKSGKYKCEVVGHKAKGSVKIEKEGN